MSVIVSKGNSPYKVSSGHTDSGDVVVSGGSMFVLSAGVANATTVSSGGFLTINKGGSGSASFLLGGTETISGTETGDFIESGGSQRALAAGKAISSTIESGGLLTVFSGGTASGATVNSGGKMLVAGGGVAVGMTTNFGAVVSNAGVVKANSSSSAVIGGVVTNANIIEALGSGAVVRILGAVAGTGSGTLLAVGSGARVELDGAVISGGKLQTQSGGEIDVNFGVLSGATIASGSLIKIYDDGMLQLAGRIANSGLISALGSTGPTTLAISGAVVLSGGGKVSLSLNPNNYIVSAASGATLSNVNNTIAGAGIIGFDAGLALVNSGTINANTVSAPLQVFASTVNAGKLEATTTGTLILAANVSNTGTGTILASGSGAHVVLNGATITGGKLQTQSGGEIDVNFGVLNGATIASGSIVDIDDGGTLALGGRITNLGLISALGNAFPASLAISGTVVLSGGGKVSLSPNGNNHIVSAASGATLSNVNNTIAGAGIIGFDGGLALVNSGTINANTVSAPLQVFASTVNAGKLEATTTGTLILAANISNTGTGTILASGSGAHVVLNGATITGGKLQTQAGGEIDVNFGALSGATIASGSIVDINGGGTLALGGRITNLGLISALGSASPASLAISGTVVLSGGGKVSLSPNGNNYIVSAASGATLSNVNNMIAGAGIIGFGGGLALVNSGTINANTASLLVIAAASAINAGKLEATTSGQLILATNVSNANTIAALGAGADVLINFATIFNSGAGTILVSGSGAHVDLDVATISGGKLQTSGAGAVIETQNGTINVLSGCTIAAASLLEVINGGTLTLTSGAIGAGAVVETFTDGTVSVTGTVHNSGTLFASASNSVVLITSGAVVTGGVARVGDGTVFIAASSSENVAFLANGSGGLVLNGLGSAYAGRVSGFGFGSSAHSDHAQFIDFTGVNFAGASVSFTSANPSNTSGRLTVTDGVHSASVVLVGTYSSGNFTSANVGGHVRITDPGAASPSVDLGLLVNYIAASFASAGVHGGAVVTEAPPTASTPLLAHPHLG